MKTKLVMLAMLVASGSVFAADATSIANADTNSISSAYAANLGQGNGNSITFNSTSPSAIKQDVHYSGQYKTVPNVYAPPVGVTAPCIVGWSAGLSIVGVGVSAGTGTEDKECTNRENARMLHAFGEVKGAVSLLCQNDRVYKAMKDRCDLAMAKDYPQPAPVVQEAPAAQAVDAVPTTTKTTTE